MKTDWIVRLQMTLLLFVAAQILLRLMPVAVATDIGTVRIVGPIELETSEMHPLWIKETCK